MPKNRSARKRSGYKVGKGRPPVATRWKPGQSGNPKGRPKGAKNLATIFNDALNQRLEIVDKGKPRKISAREGIVMRLVSQALKGDIKATAFVLAKEPEIERKAARSTKVNTEKMSPEEVSKAYFAMVKGTDSSDDDE